VFGRQKIGLAEYLVDKVQRARAAVRCSDGQLDPCHLYHSAPSGPRV